MMFGLLASPLTGCKSKKELVTPPPTEEANAGAQAQIDKARAALEALLGEAPAKTLAELEDKERRLQEIKNLGLQDPAIQTLIRRLESQFAREREALTAQKEEELTASAKLDQAFSEIANSGNLAIANTKIQQALRLFSSNDSPVFIIINEEGGVKDYDRPTTIGKYLNYLKDQGKSINIVDKIIYDANGKIKELELKKKQ